MKFFIYHDKSIFGMGTGSTMNLTSEDELHRYHSDDEIARMLKEEHTDAGYPDLVLLPDDIPVIEETYHIGRAVFHLWNVWDCARDIVVGDATFTKRIVDLTNREGICELEAGSYVEFTGYDFKNVLELHDCFNDKSDSIVSCDIAECLKRSTERKERSIQALKGIKTGKGYTDTDKSRYETWIREDDVIIAKLSEPVETDIDYISFLYREKQDKYWEKKWNKDYRRAKKTDYRSLCFNYPVGPRNYAGEYTEHEGVRRLFTLDEIFLHGADVRSRCAAITDVKKSREELKGINVIGTIDETFGYD